MNNNLLPGDICNVVSIDGNEIVLKRNDGTLFMISEGWEDDDCVHNGIIVSEGYK